MATEVCVVARRRLVRAGLVRILEGMSFHVAIEAGFLHEIAALPWPNGLVLIDRPDSLPELDREIGRLGRDTGVHFVVLADSIDPDSLTAAYAAGAAGFLLHDISPEALHGSLRLVMAGERVFPSELAALLADWNWRARLQFDAAGGTGLSERETEIVRCLADGMPNKVIASALTITESTVKVHLKSILRKLGVSNRTQAAIWAVNRAGPLAAPLSAGHLSTSTAPGSLVAH
jgi:two-component system nitrate/nitrite response regulator NarL